MVCPSPGRIYSTSIFYRDFDFSLRIFFFFIYPCAATLLPLSFSRHLKSPGSCPLEKRYFDSSFLRLARPSQGLLHFRPFFLVAKRQVLTRWGSPPTLPLRWVSPLSPLLRCTPFLPLLEQSLFPPPLFFPRSACWRRGP